MRFLILFSALCLTSTPPARAEKEGASIYRGQCQKCHGAKGDGKGHDQMKIKPADLRSEAVQGKTDEQLFNSIAFGVGHKEYAHAFVERGLSRAQIAAVVTFLRTFKEKK